MRTCRQQYERGGEKANGFEYVYINVGKCRKTNYEEKIFLNRAKLLRFGLHFG